MNILCRMPDRDLSPENLGEIAGLIYDTDPYIYPAMFSSREEAVDIIPRMIRSGDAMFNPDNLYIALSDGSVAGIILWHRGPLLWDEGIYLSCGGRSPYIEDVRRRYFSNYASIPPDTVSIINVCASVPGRGIGGRLMDAFLREVPGPYELYVLADNAPAIRLYQKHGFQITDTCRGYSAAPMDLICCQMRKQPGTADR